MYALHLFLGGSPPSVRTASLVEEATFPEASSQAPASSSSQAPCVRTASTSAQLPCEMEKPTQALLVDTAREKPTLYARLPKRDIIACTQQQCLHCMDASATYLMMPCRHLTHCKVCRQAYIDHHRRAIGRHHEGASPSQRLNKKSLGSYEIDCVVCRQIGRLVLWTDQAVFMP